MHTTVFAAKPWCPIFGSTHARFVCEGSVVPDLRQHALGGLRGEVSLRHFHENGPSCPPGVNGELGLVLLFAQPSAEPDVVWL